MTKEQEMVQWMQDCRTKINAINGRDYNEGIGYVCNEFLARFAPKPMTFMEAVEAMKQGKKVRREAWEEGDFLYVNMQGLVRSSSTHQLTASTIYNYMATDWTIFTEVASNG